MIRDGALAASGLLSPKMQRPERVPAAARGHLEHALQRGSSWVDEHGRDRYRRGLYTFLRRTVAVPDAHDVRRHQPRVLRGRARVRTNTPLQALTLLNDRAFVRGGAGAGRARRQRCADSARPGRPSPSGWSSPAIRSRPSSTRLARLRRRRAVAVRASDPTPPRRSRRSPAARQSAADAAAWTLVANVLLNLDETVTKE